MRSKVLHSVLKYVEAGESLRQAKFGSSHDRQIKSARCAEAAALLVVVSCVRYGVSLLNLVGFTLRPFASLRAPASTRALCFLYSIPDERLDS